MTNELEMFYVHQPRDYTTAGATHPISNLEASQQRLQCLRRYFKKLKLIEPTTPLNRRRKNIMQIEIYTTEGWIRKLKYERLV